MTTGDWESATTDHLVMLPSTGDTVQDRRTRLAIVINRSHAPHPVHLPVRPGSGWQSLLPSANAGIGMIAARSVGFHVEVW
jgi:glycogen operon protein